MTLLGNASAPAVCCQTAISAAWPCARLAAARGVGGAILQLLMAKARERGDTAVVLNAQTVAAPFYARHGFVQQGEEFEEAGIAHIEMRLVF